MTSLILRREILSNKGVLGILQDPEGAEICRTLERPWQENEQNVSCIPCSTYKVVPYSSDKYPHAFEVLEVEGRTAILIHAGNYISHTQGCILVGKEWVFMGDPNQLAVASSKTTLRNLIELYPSGFQLEII